MRFDPKIVRPDEAIFDQDGELELPDELACLVDQLSDDAKRLEQAYPARRMQEVAPSPAMQVVVAPSGRSDRKMLWRSLAGASLASVLLAVCVLNVEPWRIRRTGSSAPQPSGPIGHSTTGALMTNVATKPARSAVATLDPPVFPGPTSDQLLYEYHLQYGASPRPEASPTSWLGETTGPELEALMDLWERDEPKITTVSF